MMVDVSNLGKAVNLVDKMRKMTAAEQRLLKIKVGEAARGDEQALASVIFFPHDHYLFERGNLPIFREIIFLILQAQR